VAKGDSSRTATWLSTHPAPDRRIERIEEESALLRVKPMRTLLTAGLAPVQTALGRKPAAGATVGSGAAITPVASAPAATPVKATTPLKVSVAAPAKETKLYENSKGGYRLLYPANWSVRSDGKTAATIAPVEGTPEVAGRPEVVYGVLVNLYRKFGNETTKDDDVDEARKTGDRLNSAFGDLRAQVLAASPHLSRVKGSGKDFRSADRRRRGVVLTGRNPRTGIAERVTMVARELKDGRVVYLLFVTPEADAASYDTTLHAMMDSLKGLVARG
jgi:hypothetical protein